MQLINSEICKFKIVSDPPKRVRQRASVGCRLMQKWGLIDPIRFGFLVGAETEGPINQIDQLTVINFLPRMLFSLHLSRTYFVSSLSNFSSLLHFLRFALPVRRQRNWNSSPRRAEVIKNHLKRERFDHCMHVVTETLESNDEKFSASIRCDFQSCLLCTNKYFVRKT